VLGGQLWWQPACLQCAVQGCTTFSRTCFASGKAPKVCAHAGGRPVRVDAEDAAGLAHAAGEPAAAGPLEAQLRTSAEAGLHAGGARAQQVTLVTEF